MKHIAGLSTLGVKGGLDCHIQVARPAYQAPEFPISDYGHMSRIPQTTHEPITYDFKRMWSLPRTTHEPTTFDFGSPSHFTRVDCMDLPNLAPQLPRPVHTSPTSAGGFTAAPGWLPDHIRTVYPQPRGKSASTDAFSLRLSVPFLPPGGGPPDSLQTYGFAADTLRIPHT
jgi:hypothetical protein